jgi:hypothetical protein
MFQNVSRILWLLVAIAWLVAVFGASQAHADDPRAVRALERIAAALERCECR